MSKKKASDDLLSEIEEQVAQMTDEELQAFAEQHKATLAAARERTAGQKDDPAYQAQQREQRQKRAAFQKAKLARCKELGIL